MCQDPLAAQAIKTIREEVREIKNLHLDQRLTKLETYFKIGAWLIGLVAPLVTAVLNHVFDRFLP